MSDFNADAREALAAFLNRYDELCDRQKFRSANALLNTDGICLLRGVAALLNPDPALSTTTENYGGADSPHAPEPVAWTGSGSIIALQDGREGFIWPAKADAHPIPLYAHPAPTCTAQTGPAAACVYREPLLRTAADMERG